jgi:putative hydroxymethylpyrimidine transport system ATP-binding protein
VKPEFLRLRTHQGLVGKERFFEDFELVFPVGGITAILGASGVGKSTLLKALAGLLPSTSIQVQSSFSRIALMAQQDLLLPWLSVLENVLLGYSLRGDLQEKHQILALDLLEKVGLKKWANAKPFTLSGGMRQRVALARTFIEDASLILMDEPFSALDLVNRYELQNLAADLFKEKQGESSKTVVMVTHDPKEALRLADKILILGEFPAKICHEMNVDLPEAIKSIKSISSSRAADSPEVLKQESELIQMLIDISKKETGGEQI